MIRPLRRTRSGLCPCVTAGSNPTSRQDADRPAQPGYAMHPMFVLPFILIWIVTVLPADTLLAARRPSKDFCANPPLVEPVKKLLSLKYYQQWRPIALGDLPKPHQRMWRRSLNRFDCPGIAMRAEERRVGEE